MKKNFDFYNQLQRIKGLSFRLNKKNLYKIDKNNFIDDDSIDQNLLVRWDYKSLKYIKKGYIPFFDKDYFIKNFKNENLEKPKILTWHKNEFIEI